MATSYSVGYPVRPELRAGESIHSFICRFFWSNGHIVPEPLLQAAREVYKRGSLESRELLREAAVPTDLLTLGLGFMSKLNIQKTGFDKPPWLPVRFPRPRFCVQCLLIFGTHQELWNLPLFTACPLHRCHLVHSCFRCELSFSWLELRPNWSCKCGTSITAAKTARAFTRITRLCAVLAGATDSGVSSEMRRATESSRPHKGIYQVADVYGTLAWTQILLHWVRRSHVPYFVPRPARRVDYYPFLLPWDACVAIVRPSQFVDAIRRLFLRIHESGEETLLRVWRPDDRVDFLSTLRYLDLLSRDGNPFWSALHQSRDRFFETYTIKLAGASLYLDPALPLVNCQRMLTELCRWWFSFSCFAVSLKADETDDSLSVPLMAPAVVRDKGTLVAILNELFVLAQKQLSLAAMHELALEWEIPVQMRQVFSPAVIIPELFQFLTSLKSKRRHVILDLLREMNRETSACSPKEQDQRG